MARKRILVVKLSSLGDMFHALPTVHCLKVGLDADIDWVTQPEYVGLTACCTDVSEVFAFPRQHGLTRFGSFLRALRSRKYDMVVDLQGLLKSAVVAKLARGRKVIGPSFHREGANLLYDAVAGKRDKNRHAVEECLDVIRYLGLDVLPVEFRVRFPLQHLPGANPGIAVVPVSRGVNKNWPAANFIEAARTLRKQIGCDIYLFGTQADRPVCETIRLALSLEAGGGQVMNLAGQTDLVQMGGWLSAMRLVVANDSGPIHMAAAVGVPVVAVFGPTDPRRTGPYGAWHRVVTSDVSCRPCFRKTCAQKGPECLSRVSPDKVVSAAIEILGARAA